MSRLKNSCDESVLRMRVYVVNSSVYIPIRSTACLCSYASFISIFRAVFVNSLQHGHDNGNIK
jgi:hypothetical protein